MKKSGSFWLSLEKYLSHVIGRSPLPWPVIGIGLMVVVVLSSALSVKTSLVGARNTREAIEVSVENGDYQMASELYEKCQVSKCQSVTENVLGAESELEEKVFPEKVVERKIAELASRLEQYPNHFEMLLEISRLYTLVGNKEQTDEYREKARILDPNNEIFK